MEKPSSNNTGTKTSFFGMERQGDFSAPFHVRPKAKGNFPIVSVVMPVRNEEIFIERSLGAILVQDYPHDRYEVIVVDGMSTDRTRSLVKKLAQESDVEVRLLDNPGLIVSPALNIGIRAAKGDIIARMDGHTIAEPNYLREVVLGLEQTGADNVGSHTDFVAEDRFGKAVALGVNHPFGLGSARIHYQAKEEQEVDTVFPGAWRREAFEKFGMFDEYFVRTQDSEFNYRTRMLGGRIWLCPRIRARYYCRSSPAKLAKQYFQYGFWKTRLMFKLGGKLKLRHFAAPALVAGQICSILLIMQGCMRAAGWMWRFGLVFPVLYLFAVLGASLHSAAKNHAGQLLPLFFLVFPTLHIAWGTGFLLGLIKRPEKGRFAPLPQKEITEPMQFKLKKEEIWFEALPEIEKIKEENIQIKAAMELINKR